MSSDVKRLITKEHGKIRAMSKVTPHPAEPFYGVPSPAAGSDEPEGEPAADTWAGQKKRTSLDNGAWQRGVSGHTLPLRDQDRLIYVMTDKLHPMVIHALVSLESPLDRDHLLTIIETLEAEYAIMCSVIQDGAWLKKDLIPEDHITVQEVPADEEITEAVSRIVSSELPANMPLWHLGALNQPSTGQYMLVVSVHHCIGDGIACMTVLDKLLKRTEISTTPPAQRKIPCWIRLIQTLCLILLTPIVVIRLVFMQRDPKTCLQATTQTPTKVCTWLSPMPLKQVNKMAKAARATINDVLTSVTSGGVHRYIEMKSGKPFRKDLKCIVPFNVRSFPERFDLNNRVGAVFMHLPTACTDPVKRVRQTKKRMDNLKRSAWIPVTLMLIRVTTRAMSARICNWVQDFYSSKCTILMSNIRSAKTESELMGMKVKTVMGFVPLPGHLALGISVVSYSDTIMLGIVANADVLLEPKELVDCFVAEYTALKDALGIEDEPPEPVVLFTDADGRSSPDEELAQEPEAADTTATGERRRSSSKELSRINSAQSGPIDRNTSARSVQSAQSASIAIRVDDDEKSETSKPDAPAAGESMGQAYTIM